MEKTIINDLVNKYIPDSPLPPDLMKLCVSYLVEVKKDYYPDGQLWDETPRVNGERHGLYKMWHPNGQLKNEISYVHGEVHGLFKEWHKNGHQICEVPYIKGERHDVHKTWSEWSIEDRNTINGW